MEATIFVVSVFGGFFAWYFYFGLGYFLNGGSWGRNSVIMPFQCFFQDCYLNFFGGTNRRANFIKKLIGKKHKGCTGSIKGRTKSWENDYVRDNNLFCECADDVLPRPVFFWLEATTVPLFGFFGIKGLLGIILLFIEKIRLLMLF